MLKKLLDKLTPKKEPLQFWNVLLSAISIKENENFGELTFPKGEQIFIEKLLISSNVTSTAYITLYDQNNIKLANKIPLDLIANGGYLQIPVSELQNKYFNGFDLCFLADGFTKIEVQLKDNLTAGQFANFGFLCNQLKKGL